MSNIKAGNCCKKVSCCTCMKGLILIYFDENIKACISLMNNCPISLHINLVHDDSLESLARYTVAVSKLEHLLYI